MANVINISSHGSTGGQETIKVDGLIKGDGKGNLSAAVAGVDYDYPALSGTGAPTDETVGAVNQLYLKTTEPYEIYRCDSITDGVYTWVKVTQKGEAGQDGTTPHIDETTGNWFIGDTDTGVNAVGANGDDGITPHIDETTNTWFIGDTDTGIKAIGTDGQDGQNGVDGTTPHIENNYWYIGETNTGIIANGQSNTEIVQITLLAADWNSETLELSITCNGVLDGDTDQIIKIIPTDEGKDSYEGYGIKCIDSSLNTLVFKAETIPNEDISIYVGLENTADVGEIYSTEEVVIGRWIDGKPIYRMTIVDVLPTTRDTIDARTDVPWKNKNMDNLVNMYGSIYGLSSYPIIRTHLFDNTYMRLWLTPTSMNIVINDPTCLGRPFYLTVEYTKTTDTATIAIPSATALAEAYEEGVNEA